jgi:2,4-dienoyl-CoA reductase-like NADH-dependent reductase (Old Yellow Enzyme family)
MNNNSTATAKSALQFACGLQMKNRFMLAPLTNLQSHEDGTLSDDELNWLTMRAKGQFGLVMTCATSVQHNGRSWKGQLGIHTDDHIEGHKRLTTALRELGSLSVVQLHHGGVRANSELTGEQVVAPSKSEKYKARALSTTEVEQLRDDFIAAAVRAKQAGYDGVEVHGAHGYMITQFISTEYNQRNDKYGGSLENRARLLFEIVDGIRKACGNKFLLGVRLSPERFGMQLEEVITISQQLIDNGKIDFLDISLWDVFKPAEETGKPLMDYFTSLDKKEVKLTVAGNIHSSATVSKVLNAGVDFVTIGKSGILHHDFPVKVMNDPIFQSKETPVTADYLRQEGLGEAFVQYMRNWKGFVVE